MRHEFVPRSEPTGTFMYGSLVYRYIGSFCLYCGKRQAAEIASQLETEEECPGPRKEP